MDATQDVPYVTDAQGNPRAVLVPIELWREIASEHETEYLLRNPAMRARLLAARARTEDVPLDDVLHTLGL